MRHVLSTLVLLLAGLYVMGQDRHEIREGNVSFITSQSVYVKFPSMERMAAGDTLFLKQGDTYVPALQIKNLSSISCVCVPLVAKEFKVADAIYAKVPPGADRETVQQRVSADSAGRAGRPESDSLAEVAAVAAVAVGEAAAVDDTTGAEAADADTAVAEAAGRAGLQQQISGRISVSSYSHFYNRESVRSQRMRYTFSIQARNLGNTGFSAESYVSFVHSNTNWEEIKGNIFRGLKIYNLSVRYDFNETMYLSAGRKINRRLSSVGAIDGLQFEKRFGSLILGAFAGSRPDYKDYGVNPDLLQYGAYLGHVLQKPKLSMENSLAFVEQTNRSNTDRRFLYFQHSSWLMKNLYIFASAEADMYKKVNDTTTNTLDLSNVYLSVRYRIIRPLSVGLSYSSRQNVIYYETYKDFVERLIDNEALQGWRLSIHARPARYLVMGVYGGYRYRKADPRPSKNVHAYATYSRIPGIGVSATLSTTWLWTSYLSGRIYSLGLSRELIPGKLNGGLKYRYVDYLYRTSETGLAQNVLEASLSWRIYQKLSLSVYYEGTFETSDPYNRLYINVSQRF
jgi:hypothetical protein